MKACVRTERSRTPKALERIEDERDRCKRDLLHKGETKACSTKFNATKAGLRLTGISAEKVCTSCTRVVSSYQIMHKGVQ